VEAGFSAVRYVSHCAGGLAMHAAKSAVEQALTDILAQRAQCPIHEMIGGAGRGFIAAYANINRGIAMRSPAGFASAARAAIAAGYRNIKIAPFDGVIAEDADSTPIDARIREGLDRVHAVRDAIGWDPRADDRLSLALRRTARNGVDPRSRQCTPILDRMSHFRAAVTVWRHRAAAALRARVRHETRRWRDDCGCGPGNGQVRGRAVRCTHAGCQVCWWLSRDVCDRQVCAAHEVLFLPHNPTGPIAHLASIRSARRCPVCCGWSINGRSQRCSTNLSPAIQHACWMAFSWCPGCLDSGAASTVHWL